MEPTSTPPAPVPLQAGETVDVIVQGARVDYVDARSISLTYPASNRVDARNYEYLTVDPAEPAVTVVRTIPADGQPKPGDLWRDRHGTLYAAIRPTPEFGPVDEADVHLKPVLGLGPYGPWVIVHADRELGPITLEYRPKPSPQQVAAAALVAS